MMCRWVSEYWIWFGVDSAIDCTAFYTAKPWRERRCVFKREVTFFTKGVLWWLNTHLSADGEIGQSGVFCWFDYLWGVIFGELRATLFHTFLFWSDVNKLIDGKWFPLVLRQSSPVRDGHDVLWEREHTSSSIFFLLKKGFHLFISKSCSTPFQHLMRTSVCPMLNVLSSVSVVCLLVVGELFFSTDKNQSS